ncbi:protein PSK SIMULATOR 1-like [Apium graveolens]|uniref:protein PSK SIMULATOR 1-like n=1 Tax=Apium graveolens TaxID=4045 RepID=UPI003D799ACB
MDSGFGKLWRKSRTSHGAETDKAVIGILVFEVSTMMSKLVSLWERLSDKQMNRLRKEVVQSPGVCNFVSSDVNYLMNLVLVEIMDDLGGVAESVARLGKRCVDPLYHHLEYVVEYYVEFDSDWCVWEYRYTKMERKVKKMGRFSAVTAQLYQELEVLAELDQSISRMRAGATGLSKMKLHDARERIIRQRHEVKKLREMSPWIRTYDYTVRLLLRSLLTVLERIKQVFGIDQVQGNVKPQSCGNGPLVRSQSMHVLKRPSEYTNPTSDLRPLGRSVSLLGQNSVRNNPDAYELHVSKQSSILCGVPVQGNARTLSNVGSFKGCSLSQSNPPAMLSCMPTNNFSRKSGAFDKDTDIINDTSSGNFSREQMYCKTISPFISNHKLLSAPQSTLGGAALAVHYANVILFIKKLASSSSISHDARNILYNMLPATIRTSISAKLKLFTRTLSSSIYDATLAAQWKFTVRRILRLLVPLASNMIKWRSERNFENQRIVCGTSVLLVQTLYFADQEKTEAAIAELLMGLNYISRFGRDFCGKAVKQLSCLIASDNLISYEDLSKPATQKTSPRSLAS